MGMPRTSSHEWASPFFSTTPPLLCLLVRLTMPACLSDAASEVEAQIGPAIAEHACEPHRITVADQNNITKVMNSFKNIAQRQAGT